MKKSQNQTTRARFPTYRPTDLQDSPTEDDEEDPTDWQPVVGASAAELKAEIGAQRARHSGEQKRKHPTTGRT